MQSAVTTGVRRRREEASRDSAAASRSTTHEPTSARRSTRRSASSCSTPSRTWIACCRRRHSRRCRRNHRARQAADAVDRVFMHALGRPPSPAERRLAVAAIADPARPGRPSAGWTRRSVVGGADEARVPADLLKGRTMSATHQTTLTGTERRGAPHLRAREPSRIHGRDRRRDARGARRTRTRLRQGLRQRGRRPKATADAVIVLWMAGGMAQTETFDPKRYTPFQPGVNIKDVLSTFPTIDTAVDNIKFTQGLEQIAQRHRPRHGHPHVQRRRSRLHPALAPSVPLAHRLHPAAADGDAAHRRRRLANARPEEPGRAGLHRHRADRRGRRRNRHAQGVSHRGFPRLRTRAVPHHRPAGRRVGGAAAEGAGRRTVPHPAPAVREAARAGAGASVRQRLPARRRSCARSKPPTGC